MTTNRSRRGFLARTGAAASSLIAVGTAGSTTVAAQPRTERSVEVTSAGDDWTVAATARTVERPDGEGTTVEDVWYGRPENLGLEYVRTVFWDGETALDVRNDAKQGSTSAFSNDQRAKNMEYFPLPTGNVYTGRNVLACEDKPTILLENSATNLVHGDCTAYTLFAPQNGANASDGYRGWKTTRGEYDAIVVTDGEQYLAVGQRESWRKAFDGQRIGTPADTTAWDDCYTEQDGWIDANTENAGQIDAGIGLHIRDDRQEFVGSEWGYLTWLTAIGYGDTEQRALDHTIDALENGYQEERRKTTPKR